MAHPACRNPISIQVKCIKLISRSTTFGHFIIGPKPTINVNTINKLLYH
jgi:hypothetical protein